MSVFEIFTDSMPCKIGVSLRYIFGNSLEIVLFWWPQIRIKPGIRDTLGEAWLWHKKSGVEFGQGPFC